VPWGTPPILTVPTWMPDEEIEGLVEANREWISLERAKQRPRLRLDPRHVSETDARRAARELVAMLIDEEGPELGVEVQRVQIRDQRSRWGSCSTTSSSTSYAIFASRTTRAGSGSSSSRGVLRGGCSATGCTSTARSCSRSGPAFSL
jgi:predicted metal-dependent hydrolase